MNRKKYLFLLVAVPVFLVFAQVVSFEFLKYDDTINVSENVFVLEPSVDHLLDFWKAPFLGLYIPVTYTAWTGLAVISLNVFNGRLDPGLFHLLNLIIHVCNSILIFFIIRKLLAFRSGLISGNGILYAAGFGALIFGLHPVQVETVSWVTGLKGVLSGFFALCAIYLYLVYYASQNRFFSYGAATGFFALAALSMPSTVAVPVMLFIIMLWVDGRITGRAICSFIPWMVIALAVVMVTRTAQSVAAGGEDYPWLIRPLVALDAVMFYVHKILWPDILAIDYCRTPAHVIGLSWHNPYLLIALPVIGLIYAFRRQKQWLALGCAFLAGILPVSGLLPFAHQEASTVADRYLYLSMTVVALMAAVIIIERPRPLIVLFCFVLVVLFGARSFYQCREWKNTESIMGHTLQYYPCSFRANLNYGIAIMSRGEFKRAMPYYKVAREIKPHDPLPYFNLGLAYAATGDGRQYEQQYQKLMTIDHGKAVRLKQAAVAFEKLNLSGSINNRAGVDAGKQEE